MKKDGEDKLDKVFYLLKKEQQEFLDRVSPILSMSYDDNEIMSLYSAHYIDALAQIIACFNEDTDIEYFKDTLETLIKSYKKSED